ncbi:site-2 protease family protein [Cellulosimicrobium marinum]|uniref:site-2 protease family protein n=1 Tax=Cellulosimicrobium marinum TaxID=1638992 RepID=UPI001E639DD6|nr:site-2 protease family protein [Cellulosimicrobium marinum]MCB7137351.1 site-2 protease family protein [Cellulosimicrobium marinum]
MDGPEPRDTRTPAGPRTKGWVIGRVVGAPVILTPSWFLAAAVLTVLFAPTVQRLAPRLGGEIYLVSFAFVLLLFASVFLHEVAHAVVARARGQHVTELAVTLWGGHTAYSGTSARPLDGFLISVVGPLTNLALAVVFWLTFQAQPTFSVPALLLYAAAFSNAFVGFFNLLPGLPLDGGQILESAVWAATGSRTKGTVAAGWVGRAVAVGVVAWALLWPLTLGVRPDLWTVAWAALIGAFLWSGAGQAIAAGRTREAVAGLSVRALAGPAVPVAAGVSVAAAGAEVGRAGGPHVLAVVVDAAGAPVGYVDPAAAAAVPPADAATTPVSAVVVPLPPGASVDVGLSGQDMLAALSRAGRQAAVVAVTDGGRVVGVLEVARVVTALRDARAR